MKTFFSIFVRIVSVVCVLGAFSMAHANTTITFAPVSDTVSYGSSFDVLVSIKSTDYFNTLAGSIQYPTDMVSFVSATTEHSVITHWIDAPQDGYGQISFSGIVPGGITNADGRLFKLTFHPRRKGVVTFRFGAVSLLVDDGQTLPSNIVSTPPYSITIGDSSGSEFQIKESDDRVPPEPFEIFITHDATIFNDKWFASFLATDTDSGIDHYDIQERTDPFPSDSAWQQTTSPYVLSDQSRQSYIFVRAVDRQGNIRIANYIPQGGRIGVRAGQYFVYGILGFLLCCCVWLIVRKRINRSKIQLPTA